MPPKSTHFGSRNQKESVDFGSGIRWNQSFLVSESVVSHNKRRIHHSSKSKSRHLSSCGAPQSSPLLVKGTPQKSHKIVSGIFQTRNSIFSQFVKSTSAVRETGVSRHNGGSCSYDHLLYPKNVAATNPISLCGALSLPPPPPPPSLRNSCS